MKRFRVSVGVALVGLLGTLTQVSHAGAVTQPAASATGVSERAVCGAAPVGYARCHSHIVVSENGKAITGAQPTGYKPVDLQSAYVLADAATSSPSTPQTVAIVDAFYDPNALSDVNTYRNYFKIAPLNSTGAPTFRQVSQTGGSATNLKVDGGWAQETSLDLDMVSAICPRCNILLVEAASASYSDLAVAVQEAAYLHATVISNSYGGSEFTGEKTYDPFYNQPGIPITVSSGDNGYGVEYPAASPNVIAVGGTSLVRSSASATRPGWSESAWSGAGSGCSAVEQPNAWQPSVAGCTGRLVADVSATADPNYPVSVYDSLSYHGMSGWLAFGGTSVASPIIASVYALKGNGAGVNNATALYAAGASVWDVSTGSNGSCGSTILCKAGPGWDGPTGVGTPNGTGAF